MTRRMFSRRVTTTATFAFLVAGGLAACDVPSDHDEDPNEPGVFYCVDANGTVVPEDQCDDRDGTYDGGGSFFYAYMGSSVHGNTTYAPGSRIPANHQKMKLNDAAARTRFGLPAKGVIRNSTVKTGVIGKGGPGSSLSKPSVGGSGSKGGGARGGG